MICPFAVYRPVSSHGGAMNQVLGSVIHVTAGEGDPYNEFANPANQVSSHFGIGNGQGGMADGLIEQYVDTANASWAQAAGNYSYLSVETEGQPTEPLTTNQVLSFARLFAWMSKGYCFPLQVTDTVGQKGLITHGDGGAAWGGHTGCPGPLRAAQRAQIVYLAWLSLHPLPLPVKEETMATTPIPNAQFPNRLAITAVGAGDRANHLLVFTINDPTNPGYNVIDATAGIGTADPFTVASV